MTNYGGFPAFDVAYDTGGHLVDPSSESEALAYLQSPEGAAITDLIVISHGWNNDIDEARQLYAAFFSAMQTVLKQQQIATGKRFTIVAVFWPSKRFADADLIPGGAAALAPSVDATLNSQLDQLKQIFAGDPASAGKIEHARDQIAKLDVSQSAQDDFVFALASLLTPPHGEKDECFDNAIGSVTSGSLPGHTVLANLSAPVFPIFGPPAGSQTQGHALGIFGGILGGVKAAASKLANLFTYYTMKDRAGIVGRTGVVQTIVKVQSIRPASSLRIHLIGHSFGGRLVTATANALADPRTISSLLLLEAAYSHNGLAKNWDGRGSDGSFRPVVSAPKIGGPTLITHSAHDIPVGLAYPLASRIMNQAAAAIGDANDPYGGMGRNGAQHTPEAFDDTLLPVGGQYEPLAAGKTVRNLNGDGPPPAPTITGHSDVAKPEILWAWLWSLS